MDQARADKDETRCFIFAGVLLVLTVFCCPAGCDGEGSIELVRERERVSGRRGHNAARCPSRRLILFDLVCYSATRQPPGSNPWDINILTAASPHDSPKPRVSSGLRGQESPRTRSRTAKTNEDEDDGDDDDRDDDDYAASLHNFSSSSSSSSFYASDLHTSLDRFRRQPPWQRVLAGEQSARSQKECAYCSKSQKVRCFAFLFCFIPTCLFLLWNLPLSARWQGESWWWSSRSLSGRN